MYLTRTEYDRGVNTFSPEGRLFQVEYAIEAVKLGSTAVGIRTNEGVILAVERRLTSVLLEPTSVVKILEIDSHIGTAVSGLIGDSRTLVDHARVEAQNHSFTYDEPIGVEALTQSVCDLALGFGEGTKGSMSRPFGVALLLAGYDAKKGAAQLYFSDPSGTYLQYNAKAIGAGSEGAQATLEEKYRKDMTLAEAELLALDILKQVMEDKISTTNVEMASVTSQLCAGEQLSGFIDLTGSRGSKTDGSNLFYWFTPAANGNSSAPLLLWLQGGPGSSGMTGLLYENGPYYLSDELVLQNRSVGSWNTEFNVLFIDQPIGTGYSYAGKEDAYVSNEVEVAEDLYFFLQQWYNMYEEYAELPFFITGESYGGHYIPALASKILDENEALSVSNNGDKNRVVPLAGIAIGDGLTDPCTQVQQGPQAAFDFGIINKKTFLKAQQYAAAAGRACLEGNYSSAHDFRGLMEDLVQEQSGVNVYDVRIFGSYDVMHQQLDEYLNEPSTQELLHVGDHAFSTNSHVGIQMYDDVMRSQADKFPRLLANMRVLLYQGQFDWKDGGFSNEVWINRIDWSGRNGYLSAERDIWISGDEPAGWVQTFDSLTECIINGAGHLAPMDQPERLLDMITTFVNGHTFATKE